MKFPSFGGPLGMFGADMGIERFVALPHVGPFHFINCPADERP